MKNVVGQAIDEFNSAIANTTATSNMTMSSGINRSMSGSMSGKIKNMIGRSDSQNRMDSNPPATSQNIMEVLQKAELAVKSRPNQLPSLEPISTGLHAGLKGKPLKGFESNKPVKITQQQPSFNNSESPAVKQEKSPISTLAI